VGGKTAELQERRINCAGSTPTGKMFDTRERWREKIERVFDVKSNSRRRKISNIQETGEKSAKRIINALGFSLGEGLRVDVPGGRLGRGAIALGSSHKEKATGRRIQEKKDGGENES